MTYARWIAALCLIAGVVSGVALVEAAPAVPAPMFDHRCAPNLNCGMLSMTSCPNGVLCKGSPSSATFSSCVQSTGATCNPTGLGGVNCTGFCQQAGFPNCGFTTIDCR
jgi:hypothetical protein